MSIWVRKEFLLMFSTSVQLLIIIGFIALIGICISLYFVRKNKKNNRKTTAFDTNEIVKQEESEITNDIVVQVMLPEITELLPKDISDKQYEKFKLPAGAIDMLQQTVHATYPVMKDFKSYKVQFSPETLKKLKEGSMQLVNRKDKSGFVPIARLNNSTKFREQAVLIKNLDPALVVNASMNLLTAAVGQKQLAAMQSSLDSIENKIDKLLKYRTNDYLGRIQARIIYINIIAKRFLQRGMVIENAEDHEIEHAYSQSIQDISILYNDQLDIVENIEQIRESEKVRAFKNAKYYKELTSLLDEFNSKQEIIDLNFKFAKEYYEPYVIKVRNNDLQDIPIDELASIKEQSDALVERIHHKLDKLQSDYKVLIGLNRDKYINNTNTQIKELAPVNISYHKSEINGTPSNMIIGVDENKEPYAYLPVE